MKKYLVQTALGSDCSARFWSVNDAGFAKRIKVGDSQPAIKENELSKSFPGSEFHQLELNPGEYHPRMARPIDNPTSSPGYNPDESDIVRHSRAESSGHLHALREQLEQICRVVHPKPDNYNAYGHEIRSVLILACTEIEAQWKGILKANTAISHEIKIEGDTTQKRSATTNDYVKLAKPMKLDKYLVNLTYFPWLKSISPFEGWTANKSPSKDLPWYHAYNQVKHDRESHFNEATLKHAIFAVTGCFVILCAQYGWDFALQGQEALKAFFHLVEGPVWHPSEIYVDIGVWRPRHCDSLKRKDGNQTSIESRGRAKSHNT